MTVPAVMFIEMAIDMLKAQAATVTQRELEEFRSLGQSRLDAASASVLTATDYERGYLLGLETMRALLSTNVAAANAGVEL